MPLVELEPSVSSSSSAYSSEDEEAINHNQQRYRSNVTPTQKPTSRPQLSYGTSLSQTRTYTTNRGANQGQPPRSRTMHHQSQSYSSARAHSSQNHRSRGSKNVTPPPFTAQCNILGALEPAHSVPESIKRPPKPPVPREKKDRRMIGVFESRSLSISLSKQDEKELKITPFPLGAPSLTPDRRDVKNKPPTLLFSENTPSMPPQLKAITPVSALSLGLANGPDSPSTIPSSAINIVKTKPTPLVFRSVAITTTPVLETSTDKDEETEDLTHLDYHSAPHMSIFAKEDDRALNPPHRMQAPLSSRSASTPSSDWNGTSSSSSLYANIRRSTKTQPDGGPSDSITRDHVVSPSIAAGTTKNGLGVHKSHLRVKAKTEAADLERLSRVLDAFSAIPSPKPAVPPSSYLSEPGDHGHLSRSKMSRSGSNLGRVVEEQLGILPFKLPRTKSEPKQFSASSSNRHKHEKRSRPSVNPSTSGPLPPGHASDSAPHIITIAKGSTVTASTTKGHLASRSAPSDKSSVQEPIFPPNSSRGRLEPSPIQGPSMSWDRPRLVPPSLGVPQGWIDEEDIPLAHSPAVLSPSDEPSPTSIWSKMKRKIYVGSPKLPKGTVQPQVTPMPSFELPRPPPPPSNPHLPYEYPTSSSVHTAISSDLTRPILTSERNTSSPASYVEDTRDLVDVNEKASDARRLYDRHIVPPNELFRAALDRPNTIVRIADQQLASKYNDDNDPPPQGSPPVVPLNSLPFPPRHASASVAKLKLLRPKPDLKVLVPPHDQTTTLHVRPPRSHLRPRPQSSPSSPPAMISASPSSTIVTLRRASIETLSLPTTPAPIPYSHRASRLIELTEAQKAQKWKELLEKSDKAPGGTLKIVGAGARARAVLR